MKSNGAGRDNQLYNLDSRHFLFSLHRVIKPALQLIPVDGGRERERERICSEGIKLWNGQGSPANTSQRRLEMKRTCRQLRNKCKRREDSGQRCKGGEGQGAMGTRQLVHFNGFSFYIKADQPLNVWVHLEARLLLKVKNSNGIHPEFTERENTEDFTHVCSLAATSSLLSKLCTMYSALGDATSILLAHGPYSVMSHV